MPPEDNAPRPARPFGYVLHIPREFIHDLIQRVSPRAVCVYLVLEGYRCGATETCWPGIETIAERAACGVQPVKRALAELIEAGAISKRRRPNATSVYHLPRELATPETAPETSPEVSKTTLPEVSKTTPEQIPVLTDTSLGSPAPFLIHKMSRVRSLEGAHVGEEGDPVYRLALLLTRRARDGPELDLTCVSSETRRRAP